MKDQLHRAVLALGPWQAAASADNLANIMLGHPENCRHCGASLPPQRRGKRMKYFYCRTPECRRASDAARALDSYHRRHAALLRRVAEMGPISIEELLAMRWTGPLRP